MKGIIITIIAAVVVIVIVIIFATKSKAVPTPGQAPGSDFIPDKGQGQVKSDDPIIDVVDEGGYVEEATRKDCRKDCRTFCNVPRLAVVLTGKNAKCVEKCKSDCMAGVPRSQWKPKSSF